MHRVVVLRADAGPTVGLGHLQRSLGLAAALAGRGCSCIVRAPETADVRARVEALGLRFDAAARPWSTAEEAVALDRLGATAVVVDSYAALAEDVSGLLREGRPLLVIDDLAEFPLRCDVVLNAAAGASELPYGELAPGARLLLGTEYVLLHPELWDKQPREPAATVNSVLLSVGGSTGSIEVLRRLLPVVAGVPAPFDLIVSAPPDVLLELERTVRPLERRVETASPPDTVAHIAAAADIAVSAAGGTSRELARLGVPTLAVVIADNQRRGARGLAKLGVIELFESVEEAEAGLPQALKELAGSYNRRRRLAQRGPQVVDGQGCRRAAAALLELLA
jgi:UDP-2,4-diacetamido-2,4,6-trideoxy-beta-L-altropyranose hydrolase